ncbi:hypothetical protein [Fluviicola sp.]|jgi:hypothetical protein|uniref:hypothetical protein n=1 Tax=Fluviicola sp. TaxID=1917219 RepID=UPI0031D132FC
MEKQQLKGGIFITPKEIELITGLSINRARLEHQAIRDALGKPGNRLTVREFCEYNLLDFDEVVAYINPYR